jgi:hypothetical protein
VPRTLNPERDTVVLVLKDIPLTLIEIASEVSTQLTNFSKLV